MISFNTVIQKFDQQGEKTGWTYIEVSRELIEKIKPGQKQSFRVKGKLDNYSISAIALLPMGDGHFIMPLNASMRKAVGKRKGAMLKVQLTEDKQGYIMNRDFMDCIKDDPAAKKFFSQLPGAHQRYFSKWIDTAKTEPTKVKRIMMAVNALAKGWGYTEMLRNSRNY
jgi:hypothetical protein